MWCDLKNENTPKCKLDVLILCSQFQREMNFGNQKHFIVWLKKGKMKGEWFLITKGQVQ